MSTLSQCLDEALINLIEDELKKRGYTCGGEKKEQFAGSIYILVNPPVFYTFRVIKKP